MNPSGSNQATVAGLVLAAVFLCSGCVSKPATNQKKVSSKLVVQTPVETHTFTWNVEWVVDGQVTGLVRFNSLLDMETNYVRISTFVCGANTNYSCTVPLVDSMGFYRAYTMIDTNY